MESKRENIWIIKRNKDDIQEGVPYSGEDTISFKLSSEPDQYWTTIFINSWENYLQNLPPEAVNIQPRFEDAKMIVNVSKKLSLRWIEEKLREVNLLVNEYASEE